MSSLGTERLHVRFVPPTLETGPIIPRCYTLTHSDRTGDLFLAVGPEYNQKQISGWYTRLMRDEVLAEWSFHGDGYALHIHCQVGRGLGSARYREAILRRELPLVLESFRLGDAGLFRANPDLDAASIIVHFHARKTENDVAECWGRIGAFSPEI